MLSCYLECIYIEMLVTAIQQLPFRGVGFNEKDGSSKQTFQAAAAYTHPSHLTLGGRQSVGSHLLQIL
jgi:hypothetical protein